MVKTKCNYCGAVEHTKASIGRACWFCDIGRMIKIESLDN